MIFQSRIFYLFNPCALTFNAIRTALFLVFGSCLYYADAGGSYILIVETPVQARGDSKRFAQQAANI
jgi:hypothetical protein